MYAISAALLLLSTVCQLKVADKKIDFDWSTGTLISGRVLAVSDSAITIARAEGKKVNEVLVYPFHFRLATGSYNREASDAFAYRAKDIKVGDLVVAQILQNENKTDFCVSLSLRKRLGGEITPSQKPDSKKPYHAQKNAYAEFENNGTPVPPHLSAGSRIPLPLVRKKPVPHDPQAPAPFPKGWRLF